MRHLDDTELLRAADGDTPSGDDAGRAEHLASCPQCAGAADEIRTNSRRVSAWLEWADFEADLGEPVGSVAELVAGRSVQGQADDGVISLADRREAGRGASRAQGSVRVPVRTGAAAWLKAAVIVLLVAAPLAAFPGVRAWVGERLGSEAVPEQPQDQVEDAADMMVMFSPEPGLFTVRVSSPPEDGTLTVRRSEFETATLRTDGTAEPVVAARSVRIAGGEAGAAYELEVPEAVTGVEVNVGELTIRITDEEIDAGRTIELR